MRPVSRGKAPNGTGQYSPWGLARRDLVRAMGPFCSYCEREVRNQLAVEHIRPKDPNATPNWSHLRFSWENFLLACTNCNSIKGDKNFPLTHCFWPHLDNTTRAISYDPDGSVQIEPLLPVVMHPGARATIDLVGLDRDGRSDPAGSDPRWELRELAWELANRQLQTWLQLLAERSRGEATVAAVRRAVECIADVAIGIGFWSVWMKAFRGHPQVQGRLVQAFPGTVSVCFRPPAYDRGQRVGSLL